MEDKFENNRKKERMSDKHKNRRLRRFEEVKGEKFGNSTRAEHRSLKGETMHHHHMDCDHVHHRRKAGDYREHSFKMSQRSHGREFSRRPHAAHWQGRRTYHSIEQEKRRIIRRTRHLRRKLYELNHHCHGRRDRRYHRRVEFNTRRIRA